MVQWFTSMRKSLVIKRRLKVFKFTISHYTAQNGPQSATPTATWVLETDENGEISTYTADKHLISGDPLYRNAANAVVWPRGYYKIVETEALDGTRSIRQSIG